MAYGAMATGGIAGSLAGAGAGGIAGGLGGLAAFAGPVGLALMGLGTAINAFSALKQGKEIQKELDAQARELERRAQFEKESNFIQQGLIIEDAARAEGSLIASAGKAGVRAGSGSASNYRQSVLNRFEQQKSLISRESMEKQTELYTDAYNLRKKGKQARKSSRLTAFADIIGGAGQIGLQGYDMGLWGNKNG